ncbi:MAG: hypothetical protein EAZ99_15885 [Alphaproteobacteria bacterium]|nr:MAG: hypothetical protein EAZ99_15885 [Alphaproteobacteria bacterium]
MRALKCSRVEVEAKINAAVPTWLNRAANQTRANLADGRIISDSPDWSKIKAILLEEQHGLCAYCETKLSLEQSEIDHFRPKKGKETSRSDYQNYNNSAGYYWLSHDIGNYCVSCHDCNSIHKKTKFPIRGNRAPVGTVPELMGSEEPALINPLWDWEDDPAAYISFFGPTIHSQGSGNHKQRAQIIVDLFALDKREDLIDQRMVQISFWYWELRANPASRPRPGSEHISCVSAFLALWQSNRAQAEMIGDLAYQYVRNQNVAE